jgi:hypothetical protein
MSFDLPSSVLFQVSPHCRHFIIGLSKLLFGRMTTIYWDMQEGQYFSGTDENMIYDYLRSGLLL